MFFFHCFVPAFQSCSKFRFCLDDLKHLLVGAIALMAIAPSVNAAILLTEIHYNGPTAGSDPDEFIELVNTGFDTVDLSGYRFGSGIDLLLAPGTRLGAGEVLVAARSPDDFLSAFTDYAGPLLDFGGSLSNSGETLTLQDVAGNPLWSVSYDDVAPWPTGADGDGFSLQLKVDATSPAAVNDWTAAAPNPGLWAGIRPNPPLATVDVPASLGLLMTGLLALGRARATQSVTPFLSFYRALGAHLELAILWVRHALPDSAREASCPSISLPGNPSSIAT